jgi:hypothetical protein
VPPCGPVVGRPGCPSARMAASTLSGPSQGSGGPAEKGGIETFASTRLAGGVAPDSGRSGSTIGPDRWIAVVRPNLGWCQNRSFTRRPFDHIVGLREQHERHGEAERLGELARIEVRATWPSWPVSDIQAPARPSEQPWHRRHDHEVRGCHSTTGPMTFCHLYPRTGRKIRRCAPID